MPRSLKKGPFVATQVFERVEQMNATGKKDIIKTYASSVYEAVDTIVAIETITDIISIVRSEDKKSWKTDNINLSKLRELRNSINDEALIYQELKDREWR